MSRICTTAVLTNSVRNMCPSMPLATAHISKRSHTSEKLRQIVLERLLFSAGGLTTRFRGGLPCWSPAGVDSAEVLLEDDPLIVKVLPLCVQLLFQGLLRSRWQNSLSEEVGGDLRRVSVAEGLEGAESGESEELGAGPASPSRRERRPIHRALLPLPPLISSNRQGKKNTSAMVLRTSRSAFSSCSLSAFLASAVARAAGLAPAVSIQPGGRKA